MNYESEYERLLRKENQEWELAGCARIDGDLQDMKAHTEKAQEYNRQRRELI